MNFKRKKIQNEHPQTNLFWSQEINHKRNQEVEKQSSINSSEVLIYHDRLDEKKFEFKFNQNLKENLPQNNYKINSIQNIKEYITKENKNEQKISNINTKNINNIELDNEWNESKINFDNISFVSKVNSNDNNNEQSNLVDNNLLFKSDNLDFNNDINKENNKEENEIEKFVKNYSENKNNKKNNKSSFITNSCENSLFEDKKEKEEKNIDDINKLKREKALLEENLEKEQNINKEKSYYIEILKKALNDSFLNNKGNKKPLNLGIVLEYSKSKLENEKLKKNIIMQQILCDDMKKEIEKIKRDKDKLIGKNKLYEEKNKKLEEYELRIEEKCNLEKQLKDELNKQRLANLNLQKDINDLNQKNNELMELNEKMRKDKLVINFEEKDTEYYEKLLKEKNNQINELKLENLNINKIIETRDVIGKTNENINNNLINIINDSCKNIEDISTKIKIYVEKVKENKNQNDLIIIKVLKEYIDNINPDINGNFSLQDKLKIIKDFTYLIKIKLEILFNHFEIFLKNNFNFERIKFEEKENNNYFVSSNGQNENDKNYMEKNIINNNNNYIKNNNLFKKIDLAKYKSNIRENENSKENIIKNNDFNQNQLSNYKNSFLDKKRIVFKSNLSEISKSPLDSSNNSRIKNNTKIDDLFINIYKEKLNKKKNIINLKTNDINNLKNTNSQSAVKFKINSFVKPPRRSYINVSEEISKINNTNIFPSYKKIINFNERNDNILSLNNTARKTAISLKGKDEKSSQGINLKESTNTNFVKSKFPLMLTNASSIYKKNLSNKSTFFNNNNYINYTSENNKVMETTNKKRKRKIRSNLTLEVLQRELYGNKRIDGNNNHDMNGLAEEIMKPSFLKGNNTLAINNKHEKEISKISSFTVIKTNK